MKKTVTACCALCQLNNVGNSTDIKVLNAAVKTLTKQMKANTEVGVSTGNGQTSVFVIVSPGENTLEKNLKTLGFKSKHNFERRVGYPQTGNLQMYIKNL